MAKSTIETHIHFLSHMLRKFYLCIPVLPLQPIHIKTCLGGRRYVQKLPCSQCYQDKKGHLWIN